METGLSQSLKASHLFLSEIPLEVSISLPCGSDGKESACNAEDPGLIPRSGRSPRERNGYPLQYSCLGNSMDRGMSFTFMFTHSISQGMPKIASKSPSSVQTLGCVRLSATPWTTARQDSLCITNFWSVLKLMSMKSVMPSNHLIMYFR